MLTTFKKCILVVSTCAVASMATLNMALADGWTATTSVDTRGSIIATGGAQQASVNVGGATQSSGYGILVANFFNDPSVGSGNVWLDPATNMYIQSIGAGYTYTNSSGQPVTPQSGISFSLVDIMSVTAIAQGTTNGAVSLTIVPVSGVTRGPGQLVGANTMTGTFWPYDKGGNEEIIADSPDTFNQAAAGYASSSWSSGSVSNPSEDGSGIKQEMRSRDIFGPIRWAEDVATYVSTANISLSLNQAQQMYFNVGHGPAVGIANECNVLNGGANGGASFVGTVSSIGAWTKN